MYILSPYPHTQTHTHTHTHTQLLESFETQLSCMKQDIEKKERMLTMYESSMADLSSKVHLLKKSLEEKVGTIWNNILFICVHVYTV